MAVKYSCFVSYAHGQGPLMQEFIAGLTSALESSFEPWVPVPIYIDRERLKGGYRFTEALAGAMCQSVCWAVVYSPTYHDRDYCQRELAGMQELERRRRSVLGAQLPPEYGFIVPIFFRGEDDDMPADIRDAVHFLDFRSFTTVDPNILRNASYVQAVEDLAPYVRDLHDIVSAMEPDCAGFKLPELDHPLGEPTPRFPNRAPG